MSQTQSSPPGTEQSQTESPPADRLRKTIADHLRYFFFGQPGIAGQKLIENLTAWRIVIAREDSAHEGGNQAGDGRLIFSPFAKRILPADILNLFSYPRWEKRSLIRVTDYAPLRPSPPFAAMVRIVSWAALILALLALPVLWVRLQYWQGLVVVVLTTFWVERQPLLRWLTQALTLHAIVAITLGLSVAFYAIIIRGQPETNFTVQMGAGLIFFIVIASSVPALMYYLFERQKSETLREFFLRDVIRLNPNVYTLDDAEFRYGPLADEVYSRKRSQDFLGGVQVSLLINLALTTLGWCLALLPNITRVPPEMLTPHEAIPLLIVPITHPVIFGALGSYFFGLNMLFRRYVRADLGPKAYTHFTVRQLLTVTLVWVVSVPTQLWSNLGPLGQNALLVFAFLIGIVPETALALLQDYLRNLKVLTDRVPSLREDQPLSELEGVSLYDQARLLEEGVENIENLAHHNLIDLMLRTRMPASRLIDMIDQAILYLHVADASQSADHAGPNVALATLRDYGIRTATDLERACQAAQARGQAGSSEEGSNAELKAFLSLLGRPEDQPQRLQVILDTLEDDEWMAYLREWYRHKSTSSALTLEEIESLLDNPARPAAPQSEAAPSQAESFEPDPQPG